MPLRDDGPLTWASAARPSLRGTPPNAPLLPPDDPHGAFIRHTDYDPGSVLFSLGRKTQVPVGKEGAILGQEGGVASPGGRGR